MLSTDNGETWKPFLVHDTSGTIFYIDAGTLQFFNDSVGFTSIDMGSPSRVLYKTTNGGLTWFHVTGPVWGASSFHFGAMWSEHCGWGAYLNGAGEHVESIQMTCDDWKNTWTMSLDSAYHENYVGGLGFVVVDSLHAWITAFTSANLDSGFCERTTDGGATWRQLMRGRTDSAHPERGYAQFFDKDSGIYFRNIVSPVPLVQPAYTTDGGGTWRTYDTPGLSFYRTSQGYADKAWSIGKMAVVSIDAADQGKDEYLCRFALTTDYGTTWRRDSSIIFDERFSRVAPREIVIIDERTAVIAGDEGVLVVTTNGGGSWDAHSRPTDYMLKPHRGFSSPPPQFFFVDRSRGLWFLSVKDSIGSTPYYYQTSDGGRSWNQRTDIPINDIYLTSMHSPNCIWIADTSHLLKSVDSGATFQFAGMLPQVEGDPFEAIDFVDSLCGWVFTSHGAIWGTTNAGGTWALQRNNLMSSFYGEHMLTRREGWAIDSGLRHTPDGGLHWNLCGTFPNDQDELDGVRFRTLQHGYVVGLPNTYETRDGGATWFPSSCPAWGGFLPQFTDSLHGFTAAGSTVDGGDSWQPFVFAQEAPVPGSYWWVDDSCGWMYSPQGLLHYGTFDSSTSSVLETGQASRALAGECGLLIFPNPIFHGTSFHMLLDQRSPSIRYNTDWRIVDALGRIVGSGTINAPDAGNDMSIDAKGLVPGVYVIGLTSGRENIHGTISVVK